LQRSVQIKRAALLGIELYFIPLDAAGLPHLLTGPVFSLLKMSAKKVFHHCRTKDPRMRRTKRCAVEHVVTGWNHMPDCAIEEAWRIYYQKDEEVTKSKSPSKSELSCPTIPVRHDATIAEKKSDLVHMHCDKYNITSIVTMGEN
jgi:hypothetical protein